MEPCPCDICDLKPDCTEALKLKEVLLKADEMIVDIMLIEYCRSQHGTNTKLVELLKRRLARKI